MTETDVRARMLELLHGTLLCQMIVAAAQFGVADTLAEGPLAVEEIAARVGARPDTMHRLLRGLAASGVFHEASPRVYASTPLSDTLRSGVDGSLRDWARLWGLPERHAALGWLAQSVRTGGPVFDEMYGRNWWQHLDAMPDQADVFRGAMGDLSRQLHAEAVRAYDLSGVRELVDVGGGLGQLLSTILPRYPAMRGVLFDQPSVVADAGPVLAAAGVADRVRVEGGSFFRAVPAGADAYLLSMILHDWTDDECVRILSTIRRAMPEDGEVLVIDAVLPEDGTPHDGKLRDMIMLALLTGRERTGAEFTALFERAGLRPKATLAVNGSTGLIVAVPAGDPEPDPGPDPGRDEPGRERDPAPRPGPARGSGPGFSPGPGSSPGPGLGGGAAGEAR